MLRVWILGRSIGDLVVYHLFTNWQSLVLFCSQFKCQSFFPRLLYCIHGSSHTMVSTSCTKDHGIFLQLLTEQDFKKYTNKIMNGETMVRSVIGVSPKRKSISQPHQLKIAISALQHDIPIDLADGFLRPSSTTGIRQISSLSDRRETQTWIIISNQQEHPIWAPRGSTCSQTPPKR